MTGLLPELRELLGLPARDYAAERAGTIRTLTEQVFDADGMVRAELGWADAWRLIDRIDALRAETGQPALDMDRRFYPEPTEAPAIEAEAA